MLVFCEDCGAKNVVVPAARGTGTEEYRCSSCNFLNHYIPKAPPQQKAAAPPRKKQQERALYSTRRHTVNDQNKEKKRKNSHEEPYSRAFNKIAQVPEIRGAYIYHFSDGLLAYETDAGTEESTMLQIGKAFSVCGPFGHKLLSGTQEISLVLDEQVAVCRNITVHSFLILLCPHYPLSTAGQKAFGQALNTLQVFI